MGFLRLYLAVCVIATHAGQVFPWPCHAGNDAVEVFFLISGFYMALIAGKYTSRLEFYASRFLRIFLLYWAILAAVLLVGLVGGCVFGNWGKLQPYVQYSAARNGWGGMVLAAASNLTLFFQDWVMFLSHDPGQHLRFTVDFHRNLHPLFCYLLIPQTWSVSLELCFYLVVPFLNRQSTRALLLLVLTSLTVRAGAYYLCHLDNDPWTYRFAPFEIGVFVTGMLAFRVYRWLTPRLEGLRVAVLAAKPALYPVLLLVLLAAFGVAAWGLEGLDGRFGFLSARYAFFLVWAMLIPVVFFLTRSNPLDRYLGDLSYPVYLVHMLIVASLRFGFDRCHVRQAWLGYASTVVSLVAALALMHFLVHPIEARRRSLAKRIAGLQ